MANPPPQISGTLRDTINSLGFGLIVTVLLVNFSKLFLSNFFVYICGTVFTIEFLLFSLYKPNTSDIEVYREPGRRGKLRVESGSDEMIDTTSAQPSPNKKNPAGKKKEKQNKKAEKHHGVAHHSSGEKKRESLTVVTNVSLEGGTDLNSPTTPSSPTGEKSNTWKRKLGHKWETHKEKREEKKAKKDKEKDKDQEGENEKKNSDKDNTKTEEENLNDKESFEPQDEKIEDVAVTKDNDEKEDVDNKEKEEGMGKDDPFDEEFGDDDEDRKEKPKMKLKWPKKRPKSTSSLSCFHGPKLPKKSNSAEDVNDSLPDG